ncbi:MAG: hypothetical protein MST10_08870 [Lentisphaeria bacterium]|nr:hypothetical protein [Lentisphaeria bacterium]
MLLGMGDLWVALAYILNFAALLLCIGYGIYNYNRDDSEVVPIEEQNKGGHVK